VTVPEEERCAEALIAALSTGREVPGATKRDDVGEMLRVLLAFGADPNQRGGARHHRGDAGAQRTGHSGDGRGRPAPY